MQRKAAQFVYTVVHEWPDTIAYAKNEGQNCCCHHNPKECADNAFSHRSAEELRS